jgi:hypothetical protein
MSRYIVELCYQAMASQDIEDLVCAVVICRAWNLVRGLKVHVVKIYKCSVNPVTNPYPVSSH